MTVPSEALRPGVPRPPRRNPSLRTVQPTPHFLPFLPETSAGGIVVDVRDGQPYAAIIARRNRSGRSNGASQRDILKAVSLPRKPLCAKSPKKPEFTGELFVTWHRSTTGSQVQIDGFTRSFTTT